MNRIVVEIELDGVITAKNCPVFKQANGLTDYLAIRNHFAELGYVVGSYLRLC